MLLVSGIAFALIGVQSVEADTINFSSGLGAKVEFAGATDTFIFVDGLGGRDFKITLISGSPGTGFTSLPGLEGNIGGTFTIGAITTSGATQTAPVTGSGTFSIYDGAGSTLTAVLTWVDIATIGTGGTINAIGTVNLSSFLYSGANTDLLALASNPSGIVVTSFQFIPGLNLTALTTGTNVNSTSYSGSLTAVPEPTTLALVGSVLVGIAVWSRSRRRAGALDS